MVNKQHKVSAVAIQQWSWHCIKNCSSKKVTIASSRKSRQGEFRSMVSRRENSIGNSLPKERLVKFLKTGRRGNNSSA